MNTNKGSIVKQSGNDVEHCRSEKVLAQPNKRVFLQYSVKCFIFLAVFCWVQFYAPGTSVITVFHYYHIVLNFCQMNKVFGGYFLGFCFWESIFECSVSGKVFFLGSSEIPNSADPACRFIKSTPWANIFPKL